MLKAELWPLVVEGKKRITIRKRTKLRPGDDVLIHAGGKIVGRARVIRVYRKSVDEIGEEEAKKEGIPLEKLKSMLRKLYGSGHVYIIEFELLEVFNPPLDPHERAYGGLEPAEIAIEGLKRKLYENEEEKRILELVAREKSIRKVAQTLGGLEKRRIIRKILRKIRNRLTSFSS